MNINTKYIYVLIQLYRAFNTLNNEMKECKKRKKSNKQTYYVSEAIKREKMEFSASRLNVVKIHGTI